MTTPVTTDPFTLVYNKLWTYIEADETLVALIKPGNRVKVTGDKQIPIKAIVQDGDMPELVIEPAGGLTQAHFSSTSAQVVQDYRFTLTTGTLMADENLFPIKWALIRLFASIMTEHLGLDWVTSVDLASRDEEGVDTEQAKNRGTSGWSLGLTLSVMMTFNRNAGGGLPTTLQP